MNQTRIPPPDDILSAIYDVALAPECYARLLPHMDRETVPAGLSESTLLKHFHRAEEILARSTLPSKADEIATLMERFSQSTAILVDARFSVLAANGSTRSLFGVDVGASLGCAAMPEDTRATLLALVRKHLNQRTADNETADTLLELHRDNHARPTLLKLHVEILPQVGPVVLILSSELIWPEGFDAVLASAFALTPAEIAVIQRLIKSENIQEIAAARGRSVDTIRTQVKTILSKTDTRSQAELIRIVLMMMHMATAPGATRAQAVMDVARPAVQWMSMRLSDGRRMDYREFGATTGKPILVWPMDYGFTHWPQAAEEQARALGLRVILPLRGGYGPSDTPPATGSLSEHYARDMAELVAHLNLGPCPHLALGVDVMFVAKFAALFPHLITGVFGCGAVFPVTEPNQIACMDKWHRMILATARHTPRLLPFLIKAGFALAQKAGKDAFIRNIFADAPGDLALLDDPDTREALLEGSHFTLSKDYNAADIFTRTTIEQMTMDWSQDLRALARHVPVHFLHGTEDTEIPPEMLAQHAARYPEIKIETCDNAGRFVFFRAWDKALAHLTRMA
ncbi:alpha/beta hydrolase [Celeribacter sp. PS-C1]|uniref:alpha/beta hydrolase n=1 Tax=Celeribacter sp. PS-C1 TaxID=2820813 RepID=UPI001CA5DC47|nr:alpha/beta hydrolase [Celeribacter sp. PS-C1]MBW6416773.1 alpha/beta hydrolase [Celeribacter sp. PS-C1]